MSAGVNAHMATKATSLAYWIGPSLKKGRNVTFLARRAFTLARKPRSITLRIAADSRYALYLNGRQVGAGPARGSHRRFFFDSYEVSGFLRSGTNHVAVEVHCPGRPTFQAVPVLPALWLEMGNILGTDSRWKICHDPSRIKDASIYTMQMGFAEYRDLRRELPEWHCSQDDSALWRKAKVLSKGHEMAGRRLVERDVPPLTNSTHRVVRLAAVAAVPSLNEKTRRLDAADLMQVELHFKSARTSVSEEGSRIVVRPAPSGAGAMCLLDFGRIRLGMVQLEIEGPEGAIIDLGYSEHAATRRVDTRRMNYRFADRLILREGRQRISFALHDRGFRFIQIVVRDFPAEVVLHEVSAVERLYPYKIDGAFTCDDEKLNRLWEMGENTVRLCSTDTFIDCPWREQSLWLNDMAVAGAAYFALTADRRLPLRCLSLAADGQFQDGRIPSVYPSNRAIAFPSQPALTALCIRDFWFHTGDVDAMRDLFPFLVKSLAFYDTGCNNAGLLPNRPDTWNFIDWGYNPDTVEPQGTTSVLNVLVAAAFQVASQVAGTLGEIDLHAKWTCRANRIMQSVLRVLWDDKKARLVDSMPDAFTRQSFSQHPHGLALSFDLLPEEYRAKAVAAMLHREAIPAELFFQNFVLQGLGRQGLAGKALSIIRRLWGPMVKSSSCSIWESVSGADAFQGCGSLCHAFSCAPLPFASQILLGVKPLAPGFREFSIAPQSGGLRMCNGSIPTPHGSIQMTWSRSRGVLRGEISIPRGTIGILPGGRRLKSGHHDFRLSGDVV